MPIGLRDRRLIVAEGEDGESGQPSLTRGKRLRTRGSDEYHMGGYRFVSADER